MKRAAIYYRISTPAQDERSQLEDLKKWGKDEGYIFDDVEEVFGDTKSGYDPVEERKEFERMKRYVVENNIPNILVWEVSRMSRKLIDTLQHIEFFNKHNVNVVIKKEGLQTLGGGDLSDFSIKLLSLMADIEGRLIKDRTQRGRMQSALDGKRINYAFLPLGYTVDEKNFIVLKDEEVSVVEDIFDMSIGGKSTTKIAQELSERGIQTYMMKQGKAEIIRRNGKVYESKWNAKSVQNIIRSTRYKGYRMFKGQRIEIPRIVSDEVWEEANRKLDERIGKKTRVKHNYLLAGKLICGHCKYSLRVRRKYRDGNRTKEIVYYYCDSQVLTSDPKCNTGRFDSVELDNHIYDNLIMGIVMMQSQKLDSSKEKIDIENRIQHWKVELNNIKEERRRNTILYKKRRIDEEENDAEEARLNRLANEAKSEIARLETATKDFSMSAINIEKLMSKYYWDASFDSKKSMIDEYLQKVLCYRVDKINFDITKHNRLYHKRSNHSGKILISKGDKFQKPIVNGVVYYVEMYTYYNREPIKAIVSSRRGINLSSKGLEYDLETRSVSLRKVSVSKPKNFDYYDVGEIVLCQLEADGEPMAKIISDWDVYLKIRTSDRIKKLKSIEVDLKKDPRYKPLLEVAHAFFKELGLGKYTSSTTIPDFLVELFERYEKQYSGNKNFRKFYKSARRTIN